MKTTSMLIPWKNDFINGYIFKNMGSNFTAEILEVWSFECAIFHKQ